MNNTKKPHVDCDNKIVIHICLPKKRKINNGVCHLQHSGKEQWETCSNNGFTIFHHLHTKR